ncbi:SxtJ family membrane protein [Pleomorphovibrio marinus]|uniref:SxtJ family membrane protein n=1 Tax=Pleomorphovibrio marinus TaxID=2164132 RepID=UPI000E0C21BA|nr:SxtJ family membrane protein [Pleomorphovibrio marinus]
MKFIPVKVNKKTCLETGVLFSLLFLIVGFLGEWAPAYKVSAAGLLLTLIFPSFWRPLAFLWLSFGQMLGVLTSNLILFLVYFFLVCPIAWARKLKGVDTLKLNQFKKSPKSVLEKVRHLYSDDDLKRQF